MAYSRQFVNYYLCLTLCFSVPRYFGFAQRYDVLPVYNVSTAQTSDNDTRLSARSVLAWEGNNLQVLPMPEALSGDRKRFITLLTRGLKSVTLPVSQPFISGRDAYGIVQNVGKESLGLRAPDSPLENRFRRSSQSWSPQKTALKALAAPMDRSNGYDDGGFSQTRAYDSHSSHLYEAVTIESVTRKVSPPSHCCPRALLSMEDRSAERRDSEDRSKTYVFVDTLFGVLGAITLSTNPLYGIYSLKPSEVSNAHTAMVSDVEHFTWIRIPVNLGISGTSEQASTVVVSNETITLMKSIPLNSTAPLSAEALAFVAAQTFCVGFTPTEVSSRTCTEVFRVSNNSARCHGNYHCSDGVEAVCGGYWIPTPDVKELRSGPRKEERVLVFPVRTAHLLRLYSEHKYASSVRVCLLPSLLQSSPFVAHQAGLLRFIPDVTVADTSRSLKVTVPWRTLWTRGWRAEIPVYAANLTPSVNYVALQPDSCRGLGTTRYFKREYFSAVPADISRFGDKTSGNDDDQRRTLYQPRLATFVFGNPVQSREESVLSWRKCSESAENLEQLLRNNLLQRFTFSEKVTTLCFYDPTSCPTPSSNATALEPEALRLSALNHLLNDGRAVWESMTFVDPVAGTERYTAKSDNSITGGSLIMKNWVGTGAEATADQPPSVVFKICLYASDQVENAIDLGTLTFFNGQTDQLEILTLIVLVVILVPSIFAATLSCYFLRHRKLRREFRRIRLAQQRDEIEERLLSHMWHWDINTAAQRDQAAEVRDSSEPVR